MLIGAGELESVHPVASGAENWCHRTSYKRGLSMMPLLFKEGFDIVGPAMTNTWGNEIRSRSWQMSR